jgi:hypothetical protein
MIVRLGASRSCAAKTNKGAKRPDLGSLEIQSETGSGAELVEPFAADSFHDVSQPAY